jgi:anti-anti-sigma factor
MRISCQLQGSVLVVALQGRLDIGTADTFDQQSPSWLEQGQGQIVLDLRELNYISSAGLRSLVGLAKNLKARQGQLILCGLQKFVAEVISLSGLATLIPVFDTLEEALASA